MVVVVVRGSGTCVRVEERRLRVVRVRGEGKAVCVLSQWLPMKEENRGEKFVRRQSRVWVRHHRHHLQHLLYHHHHHHHHQSRHHLYAEKRFLRRHRRRRGVQTHPRVGLRSCNADQITMASSSSCSRTLRFSFWTRSSTLRGSRKIST